MSTFDAPVEAVCIANFQGNELLLCQDGLSMKKGDLLVVKNWDTVRGVQAGSTGNSNPVRVGRPGNSPGLRAPLI